MESGPAFRKFTVIEVAVERLEWLYLNPDGPRRAAFVRPGGRVLNAEAVR